MRSWRLMHARRWIVFAATLMASDALAQSAVSCRTSPNLVGACFTVRGSLFMYDGDPPYVRIQQSSTNRVFGVLDRQLQAESDEVMPAPVMVLLGAPPFGVVEGDFTLCPLDRDSARSSMRMVCIEDASILTAKKR